MIGTATWNRRVGCGHQDIFFYLSSNSNQWSHHKSAIMQTAHGFRVLSLPIDHCRGRNANSCSASNDWDRWMIRCPWSCWSSELWNETADLVVDFASVSVLSAETSELGGWTSLILLTVHDGISAGEPLFIRFITCTCLDSVEDSGFLWKWYSLIKWNKSLVQARQKQCLSFKVILWHYGSCFGSCCHLTGNQFKRHAGSVKSNT